MEEWWEDGFGVSAAHQIHQKATASQPVHYIHIQYERVNETAKDMGMGVSESELCVYQGHGELIKTRLSIQKASRFQ